MTAPQLYEAQPIIDQLNALDGYDPEAVVEIVTGIGYDLFQQLDEKPGYFGDYNNEDWHWKLRRARNGADGFFEAVNA